tara:strand:+ start:2088 stop:3521 length:1434 start_codon:yes stop_codon:yes gene_type:complete
MSFKGFAEYVTEATKEITVAWGRYNAPTIGHEKLFTAVQKVARNGVYRIYSSQTHQNQKDKDGNYKDPLDYKTKVKYLRKMFPRHARAVIYDKKIRTMFDLMTKLYDEGFNRVNLVAGSDRVAEYEATLNKYNGVKGRHGFYNFEGGVNIISAGERDPDSDGASGMSASKLRAYAAGNDLASFTKGIPKGFKDGQALFNDVRKGLGLKESYNYREHIEFESVSDEREAYVQGSLFNEGDIVAIKESDEIGEVIMLGANYVLIEMADGKKLRKWLNSVEKIEEGAYSDAVRSKIDKEKERDELKHTRMIAKASVDDERTDDKKPKVKSEDANYHKGLSKSTAAKRKAQFNKQADMDDDNPNAYKSAPGDATAKTKVSKHTKKYRQMYGEDTVMSFNSFNDVITEDVTTALKKKSDKTGMPLSVLRQVYNRGVAAWKTGHRPGTTPSQWGHARVNSFVTKSKGTWGKADKDLADKVKGN